MVNSGYRKARDLPGVIPVFPLDGALLLPGAVLPFVALMLVVPPSRMFWTPAPPPGRAGSVLI